MKIQLRSRFNHFGPSFAGPAATSPLMAIFILGFLSFGTSFNERPDKPLASQAMVGIAYQSLILSFAFFVLFGSFIKGFAKKQSLIRNLLITFLFFGTETLRAVFVGISIQNLEFTSEMNWPYRIVAGGLTGLTIFGVTSIIINNNRSYLESLKAANDLQEELRKALSVTEDDLNQIKNEILSKIKTAIDVALRNVLQSDSNSNNESKDVVYELLRVSDDVVRPLSHELFKNEYKINQQSDQFESKKISGKRIIQLAALNPFHPMPLLAIAFGLMAGNALFDSPNMLNGISGLFFLLVSVFMATGVAKILIKPLIRNFPIFIQVLIATIVFYAMGFAIVNLQIIYEPLRIVPNSYIQLYIGAIALIFGWMIAIFKALQTAQKEVLESIKEDNQKLNWANARLGAQLWAEQRHLASVVHRDVQGKLISAALKFQNDLTNKKSDVQARDELSQTLMNLTDDLVAKPESITPSNSVIKLNSLWGEIFKIDLSISNGCSVRISNDPVCENSLNDLFVEFATNSVKHGKASKGEIEITQPSDRTIKVLMRNNGSPILENRRAGLGSHMSKLQTLSFKVENLPEGGIEIEAILPVA